MNVVSVVKFKVKDGFEDAFLEALKSYDYSNAISSKALLLGENEFVTISEYASIDAIGDDEINAPVTVRVTDIDATPKAGELA